MKADWKPFPGDAPRDRQILLRGKWRAFDILPGGQTCVVLAQYTTVMSNGTGYGWFLSHSISDLSTMNVDFTEWTDVPE